jgi:lysophospholipase L1-like esterase
LFLLFLPTHMIWKLLFTTVLLLAPAARDLHADHVNRGWVGSWTASSQLLEADNALDPSDLRDATLRQVVHLSLGGNQIRVRLSNRFGDAQLHLSAVHVARPVSPASGKIISGTDRALKFSGSPQVTIPPHADYISDPLPFVVNALSDLAITIYIDATPEEQTGHPGSRATSYLTHGDFSSAIEIPNAKTIDHWYFIAGIDVAAEQESEAIVTFGDSITDGHGATTNSNNRWPDILAQRLQAEPSTRILAVLNQGIGGNRLLSDRLGPNALSRFDHDVIAQPGVRYLIVLEGINDIGMLERNRNPDTAEHQQLVRRIIGTCEQMIVRAHSHGIKVIGATLLPFVGSDFYHPDPAGEADRQAVNEWIRGSGHFDAVIDFDKLVRDPAHPERMLAEFDSGDHLHPSPAGYAAMAQSIPLSLFMLSDPALKIAFTFDDLPAHGPLPEGETRMDVISKIIAEVRDANVPPVYGFMNGLRLEEQPADASVLQAWHSAGNPLGNHTWSHMNLSQHSIGEFEQDVVRNESLLASIMKDEDWHWFRYPFLAEGETPAKKAAVRDFLRERGYKIAAVTMSFADYFWNPPYARCRDKHDQSAITTLESTYLAAADDAIKYYRSMSYALNHRDIPYVLLMHVGAFDAEMLPKLLQLLREKDFRFVTLPEAENDEFYRNATDLNLPGAPDTLEDAMKSRQLPLPSRTDFSSKLGALCR